MNDGILLSIDEAREMRDELQGTCERLDRLIVSGGNPDPKRHIRIKRWAEMLTTRIAKSERGER